MARGSKKKYTSKQKRKASKIEKGYKKRGVSTKEAEQRAWATINQIKVAGRRVEEAAGKSEVNPALVGRRVSAIKHLPNEHYNGNDKTISAIKVLP